jgi:hypothetical protein
MQGFLVKGCNLVVTVPCADSIVAVTTRELENPLSLVGRPAAIDSRKVDGDSVEIHADILPHRAPPLANAKFLAAVDATMVLDAALAGTLDVLATFRMIMVVVVVVHILPPKVVDKRVPVAAVRQHSLREVDDPIFDDVFFNAVDVICLIAADDSIVAVELVHLELAHLVGLNHVGAVLDKGILDGEIDAELAAVCIVEVTAELLVFLKAGVPAVFELVDILVCNLDFLEADELDGCVVVLVAAGADVVLLVVVELTPDQVVRGLWSA